MVNRFFKCFDIYSFVSFCNTMQTIDRTYIAIFESMDIKELLPENKTTGEKNCIGLTQYNYVRKGYYAYAR